ncbi:glycosyltransferase [Caenimonas koreensis]|nr:glycosyltransferase [Caenimonas koreensis]
MMVKNEEHNIVDCLAPIVDLFEQVVIVDTGSTDRTRELLHERFGITPLQGELLEEECFALAPQRNRSFDVLTTPWVLTLDADERIDRDELVALIAQDDAALPEGLFCGWDTDLGDEGLVEDYKLCIFRRGHYHRGFVHDTVQPSLREAGGTASWSAMRLRHFPDLSRRVAKDARYVWRLARAQQRDPHWLRYAWFSGYMHYREGRLAAACEQLGQVHGGRPALFPVESLNASMVLASIHASQGRRGDAQAVLDDALAFHARVKDDFEVKVNFRLHPWLAQAARFASAGELEAIRPYGFGY